MTAKESSNLTLTRKRVRTRGVGILKLVLAIVALLAASLSGVGQASANTLPDQPLLCFMVDGNTNRTLTLVPAGGDGAASYDIANDYDANAGTFTLVTSIAVGSALNTQVQSEAHWVRSSNANGTSDWLRCDSYRKISFIDVVDLEDDRRSSANVALGLDANGASATGADGSTTYRVFGGQDDDIVVVDTRNTAGLAPDGKKMAWRVKFRISATDLAYLQSAGNNGVPNVSWNLMQRSLADDPGGQWKMSIVSQSNSTDVRVQCVSQTAPTSANKLQTDSSFNVSNVTIQNGMTAWITATCFMDDSGQTSDGNTTGDGIQVVVNGQASSEVVRAETGDVLPNKPATCGSGSGTPLDAGLFPNGIGSVFTVGNKPPCSATNTVDDAFVGQIAYAEVFKQ